MPPTLFDDLPLDFRDSPAIGSMVGGGTRNVHRRFNSRRQLAYRVAHGLIEIFQFLSIHPPVEGSADVGAEQPEFDVIQFVNHRVLAMCEPGMSHRRRGDNVP